MIVDTLGITDLLESLGVDKVFIDRYRNMIFNFACHEFLSVVTKKKPGRELVSLKSMFMRYYMYPKFWVMIFRSAVQLIRRGIFHLKKFLNRVLPIKRGRRL